MLVAFRTELVTLVVTRTHGPLVAAGYNIQRKALRSAGGVDQRALDKAVKRHKSNEAAKNEAGPGSPRPGPAGLPPRGGGRGEKSTRQRRARPEPTPSGGGGGSKGGTGYSGGAGDAAALLDAIESMRPRESSAASAARLAMPSAMVASSPSISPSSTNSMASAISWPIWFTVLIETIWGKRRIMEVYLNVAETGIGTYGVEAGAQRYFRHGSAQLTRVEAARIAAALPAPKRREVVDPGGFTRRHGNAIAARSGTSNCGNSVISGRCDPRLRK